MPGVDPAFGPANWPLLAVGALNHAGAVDDGDAVVELAGLAIALGKANEERHPVVAGDGGQRAHPGIGKGRDPAGADAAGEVVAGFRQLGRHDPVGALAGRLLNTGLDTGTVAGDVAGDGIEMEQRDAQRLRCLGRGWARRRESLGARQEEAVLLAERFDHRLVAGLADQLADPAVAAGIAGLRALRAGDDDDAVGARSRRLNGPGVGARHVEVLQCRGLAFGDGDQGARHCGVGQADIGQQNDVDRAGRRVAFNIGSGIDAGADGVGPGTRSCQSGNGQRAVVSGDDRQIVEVGGRGHPGERRFVELQPVGCLFMHIFGIGLAAAAIPAHELHAELLPEQRVAGVVQGGAGFQQAVRGGQCPPRFRKADDQHFLPVAIALGPQNLCLGANISWDVDFPRPGGRRQE